MFLLQCFIVFLLQGKKLPINSDCAEGYVTDEDEGAEPDKKKSNKRVSARCLVTRELSTYNLICWVNDVF